MPAERFSLKDHLFNADKVAYLAGLLEASLDNFDRAGFESAVMERMLELELKQRIAWIAETLADHLDPDFTKAAEQIRTALPPPLDPTRTDGDFGDFIFAPFGKYVEVRGLDDYEISMSLLRALTMRFSMEGSVRPFINQRPADTLDLFATWVHDDNYHVRRLVSESTRPSLPWAPRIDLAIDAPLPLLDTLHSDPTRYVTRSVANHLNDISKVEPDLVFASLERWHAQGAQDSNELQWMTRHALRTLVKRGDPRAMTLLGYSPEPDVVVEPIVLATPVVQGGESLRFSITIRARSEEALIVDYIVDFVKKNGSTSPKTFKLKRLVIPAGAREELTKSHRLRTDATTYTLYPGTHRITVVINGKPMAATDFEVRTD